MMSNWIRFSLFRATFRFAFVLGISFSLLSCLSSVRTNLVKLEGRGQEQKGKNVLQIAWVTQGLDLLSEHKTYEVELNDSWRGLSGKVGKMWPSANADLNLKYRVNSFDGKVTFLNGKRKNEIAGIQSWNYYEVVDSIANFEVKRKKKIVFALSATQYFLELVDRLKSAQIIVYAGERTVEGKKYDLVLATWGSLEEHKKDDQYLLYINKETGFAEHCEYTIRDVAFPGSLFTASISFSDFREIEGVWIPFSQHVHMGKPSNDQKKYLHRFLLKSFQFDSFLEEDLLPNGSLIKAGDSK